MMAKGFQKRGDVFAGFKRAHVQKVVVRQPIGFGGRSRLRFGPAL